jgi:hypothetical protein
MRLIILRDVSDVFIDATETVTKDKLQDTTDAGCEDDWVLLRSS